jgi:hypothetical protein
MASNLFTRAKAYCKAHPRTTYQEAIKLLSAKGKKVSGAKPSARKVGKAKPAGISTKSKSHTDKNKITANIQIGRVKTIGAVSIDNINRELGWIEALKKRIEAAQKMLKTNKNLTPGTKLGIQKEIKIWRGWIANSKRSISHYKKSI